MVNNEELMIDTQIISDLQKLGKSVEKHTARIVRSALKDNQTDSSTEKSTEETMKLAKDTIQSATHLAEHLHVKTSDKEWGNGDYIWEREL